MSLAELLPEVHSLPRPDKFRLMHELIVELAQEEGISRGEYPIWSPHESFEAATTLTSMLEADKAQAA
jgi:hypothetical protein